MVGGRGGGSPRFLSVVFDLSLCKSVNFTVSLLCNKVIFIMLCNKVIFIMLCKKSYYTRVYI